MPSSLIIHMGPSDPPAAGYFIAPTGNDTTGAGTLASPWASISKFLTVAAPGDILYCRGGAYASTGNQSLRVQGISGTASLPITIRNYPAETPVFHGSGAAWTWLLAFQGGSSYWVIDGIQTATDYVPTGFGVITCYDGNTADGGAHHITIRNCRFAWRRNMTQQEHCIYLGGYANDCTVEDNIFAGEWQSGDSNGGAGVNIGDHHPEPTNFLVQRNIFFGLSKGVYMWDVDPLNMTGSVLHNSFLDNYANIRADKHYTLTVRDNAGENAIGGVGYNLYDPTNSAYTTADHNFWDQEFDANYLLVTGETGRGAASDGTDAGALDW